MASVCGQSKVEAPRPEIKDYEALGDAETLWTRRVCLGHLAFILRKATAFYDPIKYELDKQLKQFRFDDPLQSRQKRVRDEHEGSLCHRKGEAGWLACKLWRFCHRRHSQVRWHEPSGLSDRIDEWRLWGARDDFSRFAAGEQVEIATLVQSLCGILTHHIHWQSDFREEAVDFLQGLLHVDFGACARKHAPAALRLLGQPRKYSVPTCLVAAQVVQVVFIVGLWPADDISVYLGVYVNSLEHRTIELAKLPPTAHRDPQPKRTASPSSRESQASEEDATRRCSKCDAGKASFQCTRCKIAFYYATNSVLLRNENCQKAHWKKHMKKCKKKTDTTSDLQHLQSLQVRGCIQLLESLDQQEALHHDDPLCIRALEVLLKNGWYLQGDTSLCGLFADVVTYGICIFAADLQTKLSAFTEAILPSLLEQTCDSESVESIMTWVELLLHVRYDHPVAEAFVPPSGFEPPVWIERLDAYVGRAKEVYPVNEYHSFTALLLPLNAWRVMWLEENPQVGHPTWSPECAVGSRATSPK
jgi:hypothetical protein